jgi:pimeloyl-ACP methyl ester carboxylesterase
MKLLILFSFIFITSCHFKSASNKNTIILIHGFADYPDSWDRLISYIGNDYNFVKVELPGYGNRRLIRDYSQVLEDVFIQIKPFLGKKNYLFGHDLGSLIAYNLIDKYPNQFSGLVSFNFPNINKYLAWLKNNPDSYIYRYMNNDPDAVSWEELFKWKENYKDYTKYLNYIKRNNKENLIAHYNIFFKNNLLRDFTIGIPQLLVSSTKDIYMDNDLFAIDLSSSISHISFEKYGHDLHLDGLNASIPIITAWLKNINDNKLISYEVKIIDDELINSYRSKMDFYGNIWAIGDPLVSYDVNFNKKIWRDELNSIDILPYQSGVLIAADFVAPKERHSEGRLYNLSNNKLNELVRIPHLHRIDWLEMNKKVLAASIFGNNYKQDNFLSSPAEIYEVDVEKKTMELISNKFTLLHAIKVINQDSFYTASNEGLFLWEKKDLSWSELRVAQGSLVKPYSGVGDFDVLVDKIALISPWHGDELSVINLKTKKVSKIEHDSSSGHGVIFFSMKQRDDQNGIMACFNGNSSGLYYFESSGWEQFSLIQNFACNHINKINDNTIITSGSNFLYKISF